MVRRNSEFAEVPVDCMRNELVSILAKGVVRALLRQHKPSAEPDGDPNSLFPGLEFLPKTVLSVSPGVNGPESSQT